MFCRKICLCNTEQDGFDPPQSSHGPALAEHSSLDLHKHTSQIPFFFGFLASIALSAAFLQKHGRTAEYKLAVYWKTVLKRLSARHKCQSWLWKVIVNAVGSRAYSSLHNALTKA